MAGFDLKDIPLTVQQELYEKLEKKFGSIEKTRDSAHIAREDKLKAKADVDPRTVDIKFKLVDGIRFIKV